MTKKSRNTVGCSSSYRVQKSTGIMCHQDSFHPACKSKDESSAVSDMILNLDR